mmetsp:Transcript_31167/g.71153  ORF Transcript_31167/g.71153 Transcript_31167/m.71153 type:complete len:263 (-) Transcript_31167:58-846(-)
MRRQTALGSPVVVTAKTGHKIATAAGARVLNGSSCTQLAGPRCLQCKHSPSSGSLAHYADVQHRPVTTGRCDHGPFCDRCRARMATCTLPSCICRALIRSWGETTWPEGSMATSGGASASRTVQPKSGSLQKPQSADAAAGSFFVWEESFNGNSKRNMPMVEGDEIGPALPPAKAAKETALQPSSGSASSRGLVRSDPDAAMKHGGARNGHSAVPAKRAVSAGHLADEPQPAKTKQKTTVNGFALEAAALAARRKKPLQGTS